MQRLERSHLQAVHQAREEWTGMRKEQPATGIFQDYRAVLHVHAEDSKHTGGTRPEVLAAAKKTDVQVVMFSDHRGPQPSTWYGTKDGVLFFAGSEEEGLLRFPFVEEHKVTAEDLRFLCHIEERYDASADGFVGMEIYNRHTDLKDDGDFITWLESTTKQPEQWAAFAKLYNEFPNEVFGAGCDYWPKIFAKWDKETKEKHFTGIAANDAHENQVYNGLMLDPYEVSFRNVSTHILARELTESAIRQSLRDGHVYVSHDWLCEPKGFSFVAANNLGVFNMGDDAPLVGNTRLVAQTPVPARVKLFCNGELKEEQTGDRVTFQTKTPGTYRVEAWLTADDEERPWIYSNPIYVKVPDLFSMALPSMETRPNVEIKKDITYTDGKSEDEGKHKLDLYLPKEKSGFPVLLFIHGGSWSSGDRSQYPPLGNRYASEGIGTVVMSYRLAPKNQFPAQIEDAAAAFAWVLSNIATYGGDTNRIFVSGHSAGGHLAALLALNPKYLAEHNLTPRQIRGVICLSGAYDVSDGKEKVFGSDPALRKEASPLSFAKKDVPPFLVTYCEWDYFPLGTQAQEFHAALDKAGASSKLVFIPKQNHISEMLAVTRDDDLTAKSVLDFIQRSSL